MQYGGGGGAIKNVLHFWGFGGGGGAETQHSGIDVNRAGAKKYRPGTRELKGAGRGTMNTVS